MSARPLAVVLAAAALLAAGCGGDDDSDDAATTPKTTATTATPATTPTTPAPSPDTPAGEGDAGEIAALVNRSFTSVEPTIACQTFSDRLQREVYGSTAACLKANEDDDGDDDQDPDAMKVSATKVDGDRATATVTAVGGAYAGSLGPLGFAKQGERWLIDEFTTPFLRTLLVRTFSGSGLADQAAFRSQTVRSCVGDNLKTVEEATIRRFAYDAIAERDDSASEKELAPLILRCQLRDPSGRKELRRKFEAPIQAGLRGLDIPDAAKRCILRRVREVVDDEKIVALAEESIRTGKESAEGRRIGQQAAQYCLARQRQGKTS